MIDDRQDAIAGHRPKAGGPVTERSPQVTEPPPGQRDGPGKFRFAVDSPLEGDGFEPSVPGTKQPVLVAEGELRGPNRGSQKGLFLMRYRWFESISLQRRVACEPEFLDQLPSQVCRRCRRRRYRLKRRAG
jgi:hypothetical protein